MGEPHGERPSPEEQQVLLVEYQAAQASAQHHDQLVWTVTGIVWGASMVLMGIILRSPDIGSARMLSIGLCGVGFILIVFVWSLQRQMRGLKVHKYDRCKQIEKLLGMTQHSAVAYDAGSQTRIYALISALFLVAWFLVAVSVAARG